MKQLTEIMKDVFVVEVPKDAKDIKFDFVDWQLCYTVTQQSEPFIGLMFREVIILPQGEWQYLGYCTKDEISFDVLKEFGMDEIEFRRSVLLKHGLFWDNPYRKPSAEDLWGIDTGYEESFQQWNEYEKTKLTEKLVVLKKVK